MILGDNMLHVNKLKECLRDRYSLSRCKSEIIYEIMVRKQENNIRSVKLRRGIIGLGKTSIRELRKFSVKWENEGEKIFE